MSRVEITITLDPTNEPQQTMDTVALLYSLAGSPPAEDFPPERPEKFIKDVDKTEAKTGFAKPTAPADFDADSRKGEEPSGDAQVDADGVPWNAEFHATIAGGGGKIAEKSGKWNAKRGRDNFAYADWVLKHTNKSVSEGAPLDETPEPPVDETPEPPVDETPEPPVAKTVAETLSPTETAAAKAHDTPEPPVAVEPFDDPATVTFPQLGPKLTECRKAGLIDEKGVTALLIQVSCTNAAQLMKKPEAFPVVAEALNSIILGW